MLKKTGKFLNYNVFWTGGFDSTYRVCEIISEKKHCLVQPVYVIDKERKSSATELACMAELRKKIIKRFDCAFRLKPAEIFLKDDFSPCTEVKKAFAEIKARADIGAQYEWLSQFSRTMAFKYGRIELCTQRHYPPPGWQSEVFDNPHSACPGLKEGPARTLFGCFSFPTLHLTKNDMRLKAEKTGFGDILEKTWFCHWPVAGLPCGACNPCKIARVERECVRFAFLGKELRLVSAAVRRMGKILKMRPV